jgi:hypothetical protein
MLTKKCTHIQPYTGSRARGSSTGSAAGSSSSRGGRGRFIREQVAPHLVVAPVNESTSTWEAYKVPMVSCGAVSREARSRSSRTSRGRGQEKSKVKGFKSTFNSGIPNPHDATKEYCFIRDLQLEINGVDNSLHGSPSKFEGKLVCHADMLQA